MINNFKGKYFLSNFYKSAVMYNSVTYQNNESTFQSMKTLDKKERILFSNVEPNIAKQMGRKINLKNDWELVKFDIMYDICLAKLLQNNKLKQMLISVVDEYLEEGNY